MSVHNLCSYFMLCLPFFYGSFDGFGLAAFWKVFLCRLSVAVCVCSECVYVLWLNILKFTCRKSCLWQFLLLGFSRRNWQILFSLHYRDQDQATKFNASTKIRARESPTVSLAHFPCQSAAINKLRKKRQSKALLLILMNHKKFTRTTHKDVAY